MVFPEDGAAIVVLTNQDASPAASAIANGITSILFTTEDKLAESRTAQAKAIFEGLQKGTIDRSHSERELLLQRSGAQGFSAESQFPRRAEIIYADENRTAWWDDVSIVSGDVPESYPQSVNIRDARREAQTVSGGASRLSILPGFVWASARRWSDNNKQPHVEL